MSEVLGVLQSWLADHPGVVLEIQDGAIALRWQEADGDTLVLPVLVSPSARLSASILELLKSYDGFRRFRQQQKERARG